MKVVILAGGFGTRLSEETEVRPKPMVEVGGRPLLWHIMKHFAHHGLCDFHLALGYKADYIKRYFLQYYALNGDLTIDLSNGNVNVIDKRSEPWTVHLLDTGHDTLTGGRVGRLRHRLADATFAVTYGDGVCDVDLTELVRFHKSHGLIATVTAVRPPARFGGLIFDGPRVAQFTEKPQIGEGWINGGYMIFEPAVFNYIEGDHISLEAHVLERLAREKQLAAFRHEGFWQCMDTKRDVNTLESLWHDG
jgi:glucose-1-phosphate cytidylyltransferase